MTDHLLANFGKPDIKIAGLEIWVHGKQFPDSGDEWDCGWLNITARCRAPGAGVWISGPIIHLTELEHLKSSAEKLYSRLKGKAELACREPTLRVVFEAGRLGQVSMVVAITPDHLNQTHEFHFEIDQSYLPELIRSCRRIRIKFLDGFVNKAK